MTEDVSKLNLVRLEEITYTEHEGWLTLTRSITVQITCFRSHVSKLSLDSTDPSLPLTCSSAWLRLLNF